MKKKIFCLFILFSLLFTGCDFLNDVLTNVLNEAIENPTDNPLNNPFDFPEPEFSVLGFSKESVVLTWATEESNVRYNIYVKDKNGIVTCVEENYGYSNYFVSSDDKSSYAIGILLNDIEIYKTSFKYPNLEEGKGFPSYAKISDDSYLGVECLYPSNVDLFSLKGEKENGETYHTKKYTAKELNSYLLPIRYEKNSHNNFYKLVFTIDETEYISAPYYFDYDHHLQAKKLFEDAQEKGDEDADISITLYPTL